MAINFIFFDILHWKNGFSGSKLSNEQQKIFEKSKVLS